MRLFFAIELPAVVQAALARLREPEQPEYRWADASLLHVTLAFLGEQAPDRVEALSIAARLATENSRSGTLKLGAPGRFGSPRAPRVLWVGLDGDLPRLLDLQHRLAVNIRTAGFTLEDRPYTPHITLARRRESARSGSPPAWPPRQTILAPEFPMHRLTLFESRLSPRGPTYIPRAEFPLLG